MSITIQDHDLYIDNPLYEVVSKQVQTVLYEGIDTDIVQIIYRQKAHLISKICRIAALALLTLSTLGLVLLSTKVQNWWIDSFQAPREEIVNLRPPCMLVEWTTDPKLIHPAVLNAIGQTEKKPNGLPPPLVSLVVNYLEMQKEEREGVFGASEWAAHFKVVVPPAPALPPGIEEIWQGLCPIFPGKKISETHMFVYIPATVNGSPLTLNSLGIFAKQYFPGTNAGYRYISGPVVDQLGDQPIGNSCWVLMTNEGLPGSQNRSYADQRTMVADLATRALADYEVPRALDAAVCIFARFASSKIRLFSNTHTRCQENVYGYPVVVGGFAPAGLCVSDNFFDSVDVVVAGLRKFF